MVKFSPHLVVPSALLALVMATPASARQEEPAPAPNVSDPPRLSVEGSVFSGDWVTVGMGVGYRPSYEGSDNYSAGPAPLVQGSIEGFDFGARGPGLYVDLVRDGNGDKKVKFLFGPQLLLRLDRNSGIKDAAVKALGKRDVAVELGITAGVSIDKLLNPFDKLTFAVDAGWDIAGAHDGSIVSPSVTYSSPLSRAAFASLSVSANRVDDNYARSYYSIDTVGSTASSLPVFVADGGWKSAGAFLVGGYDLSGNALDGGFSIFGLTSYNRLLGDAKRSPITSIRGDPDQWFFAGGLAYTF